jgi:hypothetical protein
MLAGDMFCAKRWAMNAFKRSNVISFAKYIPKKGLRPFKEVSIRAVDFLALTS